MKKALLLFCFLVTASHIIFAQSSVRGVINDTINKQKLQNASVLLLHARDSILYKFTRSNATGAFSFPKVDTGRYKLLVTENAYADYVDDVIVKDAGDINLGQIELTLKANILQEVVVQQKIAAMRMKGDTLEYAADSFKVREGASVEEMLKKLPGIQVDKDGKITAQGETVQKVYVDGEEFFGDDPTLATRNIQADAIDKVQVFDKKSDQATFTGIDDGEKTKSINLKLKDSKKNGYFGKLDLSSNFKDRWNNSAMINNFKGKNKLSAYGIISNTGKTGLDWGERDKYGGSGGMQYDDDFGGFYFSMNNDDEFSNGSYYGEGLPKSWSTGLNYSNKWNEDKVSLNGSYRYNKLNSEGAGSTISQSLLPGDDYFINREQSFTFSSRERHSANATYDWQIDSSTSAKITASGYSGNSLSRSNYLSSYTNAAGVAVNQNNRVTSSNGNDQNLNINAIIRKKFKKIGRSFSLNLNEIYNDNTSNGFLKSLTNYFDTTSGQFVRDSLTNQQKLNESNVNTLSARAVYTEPLSKKVFLEVNYAIRNNTSDSKRLSYDSSAEGKYETLNNEYSNDYRFNVLTNTAGAAFRYNGKKLTASAGSDAGFTNFYQKDLLLDTTYSRNYTNFFPKANFNYKFNSNTRLNFNYNGSTRQPSITQIQPVKDNTNTQFQYLGNPSLKQSFQHRFNLSFNRYNVFKQRGFWFWSSFSTTSHAIVTNQTTDKTNGITTLQYVNSNGNFNYNASINMNGKVKKLDMYVNGGFDFNGSRYSNIVNGDKNVTNNNVPSLNFGFGKDKEKKYNVWYNYNFAYNFSKSAIQTGSALNYWTQHHQLNGNLVILKKWEVNTDINYDLRQKTDVFTSDNDVFLWNAYIGRRLLKNDKAIIKITANDILNQNKGYSRDVNSNILTERSYQTLRRYFMLAFTWNFSKNPGGTPAPSN